MPSIRPWPVFLALLLVGCADTAKKPAPPATPQPATAAATAVSADRRAKLLTELAKRVMAALPAATVAVRDGAVQASVPASEVFEPDAVSLRAAGGLDLKALAQELRTCRQCVASIVVHTDAIGPAADNREFSAARAAALVACLQEAGVPAARLSGRGAGESDPVARQDTPAGRSANRRIEIVIRP